MTEEVKKEAPKTVAVSRLESLFQGNQQQLVQLKARKGQILEELESVDEGILRVEGFLQGLDFILKNPEDSAEVAPSEPKKEPPAEKIPLPTAEEMREAVEKQKEG